MIRKAILFLIVALSLAACGGQATEAPALPIPSVAPTEIAPTALPPTATALPATVAPTAVPPSATPAPAEFPFKIDSVTFVENTFNGSACNYTGVGGQVLDFVGEGVSNALIRVTGTNLDRTTTSGFADAYGAGGFELALQPTATSGSYTIQLTDAEGNPLSAEGSLIFDETCRGRVGLVVFQRDPNFAE
ncbi:MAG: hypothetical protein ACOYL5_17105, partial [Phototrophicaceae bacterium]|jgi:hypothetical protein